MASHASSDFVRSPTDLRRERAFKGQARRQFNAWAETYDRSLLNFFMFRPSYLAMLREIARWRRDAARNEFALLDIGCGTGTFATTVACLNWPARVVGLDFAHAMCVQARTKLAHRLSGLPRDDDETPLNPPPLDFVCGDSEHLGFSDADFDVVTCSNSFHHYPHQENVIREMRRVLKPGGRLILVDGFRDNVIGWIVFDVIITRVERDVFHAPWTTVRRYFQEAGFRDIHQYKINTLFPLLVTVGTAGSEADVEKTVGIAESGTDGEKGAG